MTQGHQSHSSRPKNGFTIVELLIVIVVIGILAAITIVSFNGVQTKARQTKITSDLSQLTKAITAARELRSSTLLNITNNSYTADNCVSKTSGTDLAALGSGDGCWTNYKATLSKLTEASGINVNNLVDPWGRPYFIDENEGENGNCGTDTISAYAQPFVGATRMDGTSVTIPLSHYSGC